MGPRGCGNQYFFSPKAQLWEAHSRCFMRWDTWHPSTMGGGHMGGALHQHRCGMEQGTQWARRKLHQEHRHYFACIPALMA